MRRWISFGVVVLVACVAAANLASPGAWASDSHALDSTVPTRTPKPPNTPVPPPKEKGPTDTPVPAPGTPVIVNPTNTATGVQPTKTAAPRVTNTAAAPAGTVQPTLTSTATPIERVTATPTRPVETMPAATSESTSAATVLSAPTTGGGANAGPSVEPPASPVPGDSVPGVWLLVAAAALMLFGGVLFFGRRRAKDADK